MVRALLGALSPRWHRARAVMVGTTRVLLLSVTTLASFTRWFNRVKPTEDSTVALLRPSLLARLNVAITLPPDILEHVRIKYTSEYVLAVQQADGWAVFAEGSCDAAVEEARLIELLGTTDRETCWKTYEDLCAACARVCYNCGDEECKVYVCSCCNTFRFCSTLCLHADWDGARHPCSDASRLAKIYTIG